MDTATTHNGTSPLYVVAQKGHGAVVGRLIAAGADVNKGKTNGHTPLSTAARRGYTASVAQLAASV